MSIHDDILRARLAALSTQFNQFSAQLTEEHVELGTRASGLDALRLYNSGPDALEPDAALRERLAALHTQFTQLSTSVRNEHAELRKCATKIKEMSEKSDADDLKQRESVEKIVDDASETIAELVLEQARVAAHEQVRVAAHAEASRSGTVLLRLSGCGQQRFTVSRATLTKSEGSFFEAMFSGRHSVHEEEDGAVFIDRDGTHFEHILNWMRDDEGSLPVVEALSASVKLALAVEADYYGLTRLVDVLRGRVYELALSESDSAIREEENARRAKWAARACVSSESWDLHDAAISPIDIADADAEFGSPKEGPSGFKSAWRSLGSGAAATWHEVTIKEGSHAGLLNLEEPRLRATSPNDVASRLSPPNDPPPVAIERLGRPRYREAQGKRLASSGPPVPRPLRSISRCSTRSFDKLSGRSPFEAYPLLFERYAASASGQEKDSPDSKAWASAIVESVEAFERRFERTHPNLLGRLRSVECPPDCGWFLAGGAILRSLLAATPSPGAFDGADVDCFIWAGVGDNASRSERVTALARRIYDAVAIDHEDWVISRGQFVINLACEDGDILQIVLRLYQNPSEILHGFDIDPACFGYDGQSLWALPRAIRALRYGCTVVNPLHAWPNQPTYELRLAKYAGRGFAVAVPGLRLDQIDTSRFVGVSSLEESEGVARLLMLHFEREMRVQHARDGLVNTPVPSLKSVWGRKFFAGTYGPGDHWYSEWTSFRSLPGDSGEDEYLRTEWAMLCASPVSNSDPPLRGADPNAKRAGQWLIVPALSDPDEEHSPWDWPTVDDEVRDEHWSLILDAGHDNVLRIPRKLEWSISPRSREYLNAIEPNLDAEYFAPAYRPPRADGTNKMKLKGCRTSRKAKRHTPR